MSSGGKRLVAMAVAAGMIGAALVVRNAVSEDDTGVAGMKPRLLCASELADACNTIASDNDIEVTIEPGVSSMTNLSKVDSSDAGAVPYDGWLAPAPLPAIVDEYRNALEPVLDASGPPIGRSPLAVLMWKQRYGVMEQRCGGEVSWRCLGDVTTTPWSALAGGDPLWGSVEVAHADPATSAAGLLVLGQEASSYFGKTTLARNDFDDDPGFDDWFTGLEDDVAHATSVDDMLRFGPAGVDAMGAVEAGACRQMSEATNGKDVRVVVPQPVASMDVVYTPIKDRPRGADLGEIVQGDAGRRALAGAGWRVDGLPTAGGRCVHADLAATSNLPPPGTLAALLERSPSG